MSDLDLLEMFEDDDDVKKLLKSKLLEAISKAEIDMAELSDGLTKALSEFFVDALDAGHRYVSDFLLTQAGAIYACIDPKIL